MTERRNTNGNWSYDWSWTQPYVNMEGFGSFNDAYKGLSSGDIYQKMQEEQATQKEMALLASIDEEVQNMLTYPDAEAILNKIKKEDL